MMVTVAVLAVAVLYCTGFRVRIDHYASDTHTEIRIGFPGKA
jgi:hypothetical protein